MEKLFLSLLAVSAMLFTSCDKESSSNDDTTQDDDTTVVEGYVLTITPSEAVIGDEITLTVTGDSAEDISWLACFNRVDDGVGTCLMSTLVDGSMTLTTSSDLFSAGEYTFYAAEYTLDLKTSYATVTFTE